MERESFLKPLMDANSLSQWRRLIFERIALRNMGQALRGSSRLPRKTFLRGLGGRHRVSQASLQSTIHLTECLPRQAATHSIQAPWSPRKRGPCPQGKVKRAQPKTFKNQTACFQQAVGELRVLCKPVCKTPFSPPPTRKFLAASDSCSSSIPARSNRPAIVRVHTILVNMSGSDGILRE